MRDGAIAPDRSAGCWWRTNRGAGFRHPGHGSCYASGVVGRELPGRLMRRGRKCCHGHRRYCMMTRKVAMQDGAMRISRWLAALRWNRVRCRAMACERGTAAGCRHRTKIIRSAGCNPIIPQCPRRSGVNIAAITAMARSGAQTLASGADSGWGLRRVRPIRLGAMACRMLRMGSTLLPAQTIPLPRTHPPPTPSPRPP